MTLQRVESNAALARDDPIGPGPLELKPTRRGRKVRFFGDSDTVQSSFEARMRITGAADAQRLTALCGGAQRQCWRAPFQNPPTTIDLRIVDILSSWFNDELLDRVDLSPYVVRLERLLPLCGPERSRLFALIAFELVCHPEQRAEDDGAIIASQVHYTALTTRPPSSIRCRVRLRRSTCHARISCRALAAC